MLRRFLGDRDARTLSHAARPLGVLWMSAAAAAGFGALAQIMLARQLGPGGYGVIVSANAMANLLGPFAAFGVGLMLMQKFGREGWAGRRWVAPALRVFCFCLAAALLIFLAWAVSAMESATETLAASLLAPLVLVFAAVQLAESRYQLEHRYAAVALWQLSKHASILAVAIVCSVVGLHVLGAAWGIFAISMLVGGAALLAGAGMARRGFALQGHASAPTGPTEAPTTRLILAEAWPFAATSFGFLLFLQSSIALVQAFGGAHAAGVYGLAVSIMTAAYLLPRILYRKFFLAKVSRWHFQDPEKARAFAERLVPAVALMSVPIAAALAFAGPVLIARVFGPEYQASALLLQILAFALPFRFLSAGLAVAAVETQAVRERVFWQLGMAAAAAALIWFALPRAGLAGAAWLTVCAEAALAGIYLWLAVRGRMAAPLGASGARP